MSDPQPIASVEPALPPTGVMVVSAVPGDTALVAPAADVEPSAKSETTPVSPLKPLVQSDNAPPSWLWINKHDQLFVGVFAAVFLMLSGYHWATLGGWGMRPIEIDRLPARQYDFRIDINSASWVEWTQIEGIGEVTAQKIVDDRKANGPFRRVKDLLRVKGIGPKILEKMRPFLREPSEQDAPAKGQP